MIHTETKIYTEKGGKHVQVGQVLFISSPDIESVRGVLRHEAAKFSRPVLFVTVNKGEV